MKMCVKFCQRGNQSHIAATRGQSVAIGRPDSLLFSAI